MIIKRPASLQPIPAHAECVFKGVMFDVYQWDQKLYDGRVVKFEKLKRPDTVCVFPVLPDGRILLTKQEQPGKKPFIGATGGRVDFGEDILEAAKRELLEESGYEASKYMLLDAHQPTSKVDWVIYTFIAKDIKKVNEMDLDGGEKIELMPVKFEEFVDLAGTESFAEKQVVSLFYEARLHPEKMTELKQLFSAI